VEHVVEMSCRGIFIVNVRSTKSGDQNVEVLFKRLFPVVEKQCQKAYGQNYRKIPNNFPQLIFEQVQLLGGNDVHLEKNISCGIERTDPVYSLCDGMLYPIVAFLKGTILYVCILFENNPVFTTTKLLIDSPSVTLALTLLQNMLKLVSNDYVNGVREANVAKLHDYVSVGLPFGVINEVDLNTIQTILSTTQGALSLPKNKGPAWRPISSYKGKPTLQLTIEEVIKGLQFDHDELPDKCEISGSVRCKVESENMVDVNLNFVCPKEAQVMKQMAYHPSVQYIDELPAVFKTEGTKYRTPTEEYETHKLKFTPPCGDFTLCHYKAALPQNHFPVKAFYQLKGDSKSVKVLIQLSLSDTMKNEFESFVVQVPFYNRGPIIDTSCLTQSANVYVSSDRANLLWNIGSRFPGKTRECALDVDVTFADEAGGFVKPHKYLKNLNTYITISWSIVDYSYSGLMLDTKSIELFPSNKIKITSASTFKTTEYRVWNSHGDVTDSTFNQ